MRSLTRTEWIVQIVLTNLLLIMVGICAIYYIACRENLRSVDMARTAAAEIAENLQRKEIISPHSLTEPEQYLTYNIYYQNSLPESLLQEESAGSGLTHIFRNPSGRDDIWAAESSAKAKNNGAAQSGDLQVLYAFYGQRDLQIDQLLLPFSKYILTSRSFYTVAPSLSPFGFVSIAGQPVQSEEDRCYFVYAARHLPSLPAYMAAYSLLATILFHLCVVSLIIQKRSRDRVEQIYHRYIANISHELKTPIASIQAITEILNDGAVHDETTLSRYYGIISRESRLLEHSVLQIIELSKLQDHQQQFEKTTVSPHALLDSIQERFSSRCEDAGISFSIDKSVWELPDFYTNAFRMTQLLEILLDNAFKFVADDGHIFIDATSKHRQATLRVNDDGRGISRKDLPHIFERFYKTAVDNPTGSGLGLAIAREIVDGLGEKLWVQSTEGQGTIFFITVTTK